MKKEEFILPKYGETSIVEIVPSILQVFGIRPGQNTLPPEFFVREAKGCEKIIFFLIDGLGYNQVVRYKTLPLFERFFKNANVHAITTVFPSITPAAITSIHTGLTPQQHGLFEWHMYFEEFDMVIETLPFKPQGAKKTDKLLEMGGDPKVLYDGPTIYETLGQHGVHSFAFMHQDIAGSAYSTVSQKGSELVPYIHGSDLMVKLRKKILETKGPAYFYVYWSQIDSVQHAFAPYSREHYSEISIFSNLMISEFFKKLRKQDSKNILFLLSADHGQVSTNKIVHLEDFIDLSDLLRMNKSGDVIPPTGHPRDLFLLIKPDKVNETFLRLKQCGIEKFADIMLIEDALAKGLFGLESTSQRFLARAGDILLLPREEYNIWHKGFTKNPAKLKGIHGGLSQEEMLVPFISARLNDLI